MVKKINVSVSDEANAKLKRIQHKKGLSHKDEALDMILLTIDENILE